MDSAWTICKFPTLAVKKKRSSSTGKIYSSSFFPLLTLLLHSLAVVLSIRISSRTSTQSTVISWLQNSAHLSSPTLLMFNSEELSMFVLTNAKELNAATVKLVLVAASVKFPTQIPTGFTKLTCQRSSKSITKAALIQKFWQKLKKVWNNWRSPTRNSTGTAEKMSLKAFTTQNQRT